MYYLLPAVTGSAVAQPLKFEPRTDIVRSRHSNSTAGQTARRQGVGAPPTRGLGDVTWTWIWPATRVFPRMRAGRSQGREETWMGMVDVMCLPKYPLLRWVGLNSPD
jgi:hypothetical protein